ncbi:PAC2 family protein [Microbacterium mitrae]|uniref:PAC2 family protein n=1 Tax=Microbacterium mitrae TaxID=664640 RepID=A0A5C8HQZ6_9MICO|nr:PAC2 family protein [Microbacterium mitrae]TXK05453.1 PAC2 family protein [Microbacterium mitrae]
MPQSDALYERVAHGPEVPRGLPLVVLMTGFTDAGAAVSGTVDFMRVHADLQPVAIFDNDVLLDYRARRPIVTFDADHLTDYVPPRLELCLARDALGQQFLLLAGYEPDFAWEAFADAVLDLADDYAVSSMTWVHSIGMPVPHTRPLAVTVSGNRRDLIESFSGWRPHTQVPATAGHLLEYRFAEDEQSVAGFVLLVPHYLADTDNPEATIATIEWIARANELAFLFDDLNRDLDEYRGKVAEQVAANEELQRLIARLERQYDSYRAGTTATGESSPLLGGAPMPSADELAAELERYLANRPSDDDKGSTA